MEEIEEIKKDYDSHVSLYNERGGVKENEHNVSTTAFKSAVACSVLFLKAVDKIVSYSNDLYVWNGKNFELVDDRALGKMIFKWFTDCNGILHWTSRKGKEMIEAIKNNPVTEEVVFDRHDNLINLSNGVLNLDTMVLEPHHPAYYFSYCLNVGYYKEAPVPEHFLKFLRSCFLDQNGEVDEDTVNALIQIGGYILHPQNKMKRLIVFSGNGSNGKSVLINVYKMFFARKFLAALSLSQLASEDGFARVKLLTARLNIATEMKGAKIDSEEIKKIVSGEDITVNGKFKEPLTHLPNTKILVATNSAIYFNDTSYGTERRLYIIEFPNMFEEDEEKYKRIKDPAKFRIFKASNEDDLMANLEAEASGILNLFLSGLKTLRENKWKLKETKNSKKAMTEYKEESDTLGHWLMETYTTVDLDSIDNVFAEGVSLDTMFTSFYTWYSENIPGKKFPYSKRTIAKRVREVFRVNPEYPIDGKKRITLFKNLIKVI